MAQRVSVRTPARPNQRRRRRFCCSVSDSAPLEVAAPPSLSNLNRGCARREQRQPRDAGQRQAQGQHRHLRHRPLRPRAVAGVLPPAAAPPRWAHVAATCAQEDKAEQLVSALREHVGECHPRPCCRWRRAAAAGALPGPVGAKRPCGRWPGASAVTAQLVGRTRRSLGLPADSRGAWRGADKLRTWKSIRRTPRSAVPSAAPPPRPAPTQAPTQAPARPAQTRGATC